ncbi:MAG: MSMEG_1061 family FMN-dependent PPOX-type flavoprotein [Pseudomonadota bacterium]
MKAISSIEELEAIYDTVNALSIEKVADRMTPMYASFIEASRLVIVSTVGPEGTDASPRGDDGAVVAIADEKTILLPDWRGNNRLDTLKNIVRDDRISLMFLAQGSNNVVRVNGTAIVSNNASLTARFAKGDKHPRTVIVATINELYFQCAKALMRAGIWDADMPHADVPTAGQFLKEAKDGFNAEEYDAAYPAYASERMW